jgi:protein deglycase
MARVLVPLAEGCEELEAVTVIDLLRRAGVEVVSAGLQEGLVRCSRGTRIMPDTDLDAAMEQTFDMIVLPGGQPGADHLDQDPRIHKLLREMAEQGRYTAAICAAPKVLASSGLLDGRTATSFPGVLAATGVTQTTISEQAVVCDGTVVTSRGPGTAMDFALTLIGILCGEDKRHAVEQALVRP